MLGHNASAHAEVGGIALALEDMVLGVVFDSIPSTGSLKIWALLDMSEDVIASIVGSDESKTLVLKEFLDCA